MITYVIVKVDDPVPVASWAVKKVCLNVILFIRFPLSSNFFRTESAPTIYSAYSPSGWGSKVTPPKLSFNSGRRNKVKMKKLIKIIGITLFSIPILALISAVYISDTF